MKKLATLIAAGLLLAHPAGAFTPERAAIMVDAVRANDCQMNGAEAPQYLEPLGLDSIEVQSFVDILYGADLVSISDDQETLILADALCEAEGEASLALIVGAYEAQETALEPWRPEFPPQRGADLIAIFRANDCAMSEEEAGEILPGAGFDPVQTRDIVAVMLDTDLASIDPEVMRIHLADDLCTGAADQDLTRITDAVALWIDSNLGTADTPETAEQGGE